jgi:molecular chaperone DnaK
VKVSAKDLGTGRSQEIAVTAGSGLSEEQIRRLCTDADANKEADKRRREMADLRNRADGLVYSTESTLADYGEHVNGEERSSLETALARTRDALAGDDAHELQAAVEALTQLSYKMTEKLYSVLGGGDGSSGA